MNMEMINQDLALGVENGENAGFACQLPLWIGSKSKQGLLDSCKQTGKQFSAIGKNKRVQRMGQGEDQVEVTTGQQLLASFIQSFFLGHGLAFRAVSVTTGVITVPDGTPSYHIPHCDRQAVRSCRP